jgi:hypothetical protein
MNPILPILILIVILIFVSLYAGKKQQRVKQLEAKLKRQRVAAAAKKAKAKRPRRKLFGLFTLMLLLSACGARVEYIDPAGAFVYPVDGVAVLVTESGEYTLTGASLPAGCYQLDPPAAGQTRGAASWVDADSCKDGAQ